MSVQQHRNPCSRWTGMGVHVRPEYAAEEPAHRRRVEAAAFHPCDEVWQYPSLDGGRERAPVAPTAPFAVREAALTSCQPASCGGRSRRTRIGRESVFRTIHIEIRRVDQARPDRRRQRLEGLALFPGIRDSRSASAAGAAIPTDRHAPARPKVIPALPFSRARPALECLDVTELPQDRLRVVPMNPELRDRAFRLARR